MTVSDQVQLLSFWPSPFAMRVQLALTAKDVPFTVVPEDLANKSSLLLQSNPVHKKIPVLLHNGRAVCESFVIVEYIDEAFPSPDGRDLLPKDPYDRAVARFWADFVEKKVFATLMSFVRQPRGAWEAVLEELKGYLGILEEAFGTVGKESPYFGGANLGFFDIILGPAVVCIPALETFAGIELEVDKLPQLAAWMKAIQQSPLAKCLPSSVEIVEFLRARFPAAECTLRPAAVPNLSGT